MLLRIMFIWALPDARSQALGRAVSPGRSALSPFADYSSLKFTFLEIFCLISFTVFLDRDLEWDSFSPQNVEVSVFSSTLFS